MSELNVASVNSDLCKISQFMKKKQVIVQRKMGCLSVYERSFSSAMDNCTETVNFECSILFRLPCEIRPL